MKLSKFAFLHLFALTVAAACFAGAANAATLSGTIPTDRANGEPLPRSELAAIKIFRAGTAAPIATLTGAAISGAEFGYVVPSCTAATYTATAVDIGGLESEQSAAAQVIPVAVSCRPKPPTARITAN